MHTNLASRAVLVACSITILSACDEHARDPLGPSAIAGATLSLGLPAGATSDSLAVGETVQLTANLKNNRKRPRPTTWSSSNPNVASVSTSGLVSAIAAGNATVKATNGYATDSARIIVAAKQAVAASVVITPDSVGVAAGDTVSLTAAVRDSAGATITGRVVSWSISDTTVAVISSTGRLAARAVGVAAVIASCDGASTSAKVLVSAGPAATVTITPQTATVGAGQTVALTATARDASGNAITGRAFTWATSAAQTATVSNTGVVTGVAAGIVSITAAMDGRTQSAQVTVQAASTGTTIYPGTDIQTVIGKYSTGTTFTLKAGVHRLQRLTPKDGNTFVGEPGAILSGAMLVTSFVREGSYWTASGLTVTDASAGSCEDDSPLCNRSQEFFLDDVRLKRVGSAAEVTSGRWYFDTGARKAYLADDPTGRKAELSVTSYAFQSTAHNVTIRGLIIEKYANAAQRGAIHAQDAPDWIVRDNDVRLNHGVGIRIGPRMQAINNKIHHQGQLGIGGEGADALVENNEISYNNAAGFSAGWEAGGSKFVKTSGLIVRGNFSHHTRGPGLWTDFDNINTLYEGNRVEDNRDEGIFHEISYAAVIRNNTIARNGFGRAEWVYGAGIVISASPNVEIYGNTVTDNARGITALQQNRGSGSYGTFSVENLYVHDNIITMKAVATDDSGHGNATGLAQDVGDLSYFTSRNNRFQNNTYYLGSASNYFEWMNRQIGESQWKSYGNDVTGTFNR